MLRALHGGLKPASQLSLMKACAEICFVELTELGESPTLASLVVHPDLDGLLGAPFPLQAVEKLAEAAVRHGAQVPPDVAARFAKACLRTAGPADRRAQLWVDLREWCWGRSMAGIPACPVDLPLPAGASALFREVTAGVRQGWHRVADPAAVPAAREEWVREAVALGWGEAPLALWAARIAAEEPPERAALRALPATARVLLEDRACREALQLPEAERPDGCRGSHAMLALWDDGADPRSVWRRPDVLEAVRELSGARGGGETWSLLSDAGTRLAPLVPIFGSLSERVCQFLAGDLPVRPPVQRLLDARRWALSNLQEFWWSSRAADPGAASLVLAGGALEGYYRPSSTRWLDLAEPLPKDYDLFVVVPGGAGDDATREALARELVRDAVHRLVAVGWAHGAQVVYSKEHCTGVRFCKHGFEVQFVHRVYETPCQVVHGFDLASSAMLFDGRDVWCAPRAAVAALSGVQVLDPERQSTSFHHRILKKRRSFRPLMLHPALPMPLERPRQGGLPELLYMSARNDRDAPGSVAQGLNPEP